MIVKQKMLRHLLLLTVIGYTSLLCVSIVRCDNQFVDINDEEFEKKAYVCSKSSSKSPIEVNTTNGALTVNLADSKDIASCKWIIELKKTDDPLFFRINGFVLDEKDSFIISRGGDVIYNKSRSLENFILFTGVTTGNVTVELKLTKSTAVIRVFDVAFVYNKTDETIPITLANGNGMFTLPVYNPAFNPDKSAILEFKLQLILQPPFDKYLKLVVGFEEMTIDKAKVLIQGSVNGDGTYSPTTPDLIPLNNEITITLKNFNLKEKGNQAVLYYNLYNNCTTFKKVADLKKTAVKIIPNSISLPSVSCLAIVTFEENLEVNYLLDYTAVNFVNEMDFFTIRSGNRRNSVIVAMVNKQNKGYVQDSLQDTISMGKYLFITYNSPFGMVTLPSLITITPMRGGGFFTNPTKVTFNFDKPVDLLNYVYKSNSKRVALESLKQTLSKGSLKLYDSDKLAGSDAFATFTEGDVIPEVIVSPSNTLRLEFSNATSFDASLNETDSSLNSVAALKTASFMVTGAMLKCSQTSSWLIPKNSEEKANQTIFSIQTPFLSLNTSDDTLTLMKYSKQVTEIFTMKGAKDFNSQSLPDFLLFADATYLLKYTRSKQCDPNDTSVLLQLSYNLNRLTDYETTVPLKSGAKLTIEPDMYPNKYPLREPLLNTFCLQRTRGCGWFVQNPENSTVLTTVLDLDVAPGDFLEMLGNKLSNNELPPDELAPHVLFKMSAPINKSMVISEKISGRGFKLNITEFDCGTTFTYPKATNLKIDYPFKHKACAWIVKVDSKEKGRNGNYLEFDIQYIKGTKETKGDLKIIDSSSLRDSERRIIVNNSLVYQPASVNQTIIIYEVSDPEKAAGINITWRVQPCKEWCKNGIRCILDSWRCDNVSQCGDWSDEMNCNIPPNCPDAPQPKSAGVSGWVIAFVIFPLAMIVGAIIAKFGPTVIRRFRGSSYQEFRDFSEVS